MNITNLYNKKDPTGLLYQPSALFLYAEVSVFSVLLKTSKNIEAESTLKCHHSTNCHSCRKKFANKKHAKAHTKSNIHKGQSITIKFMQVKMRNIEIQR